ncbi:peptide deformylase [Kordiimonas sp. SCSIO 12603]|uniref:peptide deformylase n=1 Tax=Kordiimonas sp. SCSIO 12603 TaxID=2829596 RepID=UPI0021026EF1|nr:peptide deformylase [Kordiimonas sp. SCSIO 12603]UTW57379.1 peptide deformylase [Kordiimonas sp. SCSIO 12603]
MPVRQLFFGTDPELRKKAVHVGVVDDTVRSDINDMFESLYEYRGIGIGANMVGIFKRIIVIDLQEDGSKNPIAMVNPEITWKSDNLVKQEEASLCFPGISAEISRPDAVEVEYLDEEGSERSMKAEGWLATVIQHEMDYLDGKSYLDHLSKMKKDRLIKKMVKAQKQNSHNHSCCEDPNCSTSH